MDTYWLIYLIYLNRIWPQRQLMPFDGNVIRSTRNANVHNLDVALANIQIYKQMFIKCKK